MSKKNFKRFAAFALAATMASGSMMTVFADAAAGTAEGTGSYEGGEMKYPTLSVTLPTIPAGTYDYIADPNGLIAAASGHYENSTFSGNTGIFFLTNTGDDGSKTYTEKSKAMSLENQNAQDIDVTVKLEEKTAGDEKIKYASDATFDASDTENKLYLAITDDAASNTKTSALSSSAAATVTATVQGVPANFEPKYVAGSGYGYVKKDDANLTDWNSCSFKMTGAINTNATWGDNVIFPAVKVTWSYAEHKDTPSVAQTSYTLAAGTALSIQVGLGDGATGATTVSSVKLKEANLELLPTYAQYSNGTITLPAASVDALISTAPATLVITFDDADTTVIEVSVDN